jgi:hypothetical protein
MLMFSMVCHFDHQGNLDIGKTRWEQVHGIIKQNFTQKEADTILSDNYVSKNNE